MPLYPFALRLLFAALSKLVLKDEGKTTSITICMTLNLSKIPIFARNKKPKCVFRPAFNCLLKFVTKT